MSDLAEVAIFTDDVPGLSAFYRSLVGSAPVADLDGLCDGLDAAGGELLLGPRDYPWGRSAYLRDPDERLVELAQS